MMMMPPKLYPKPDTGNSIADLILGLIQPGNPAEAVGDLITPMGTVGNFATRAGAGIGSQVLGKLKKLYHGTPHTFEPEPGYPLGRFKRGRIGTGEGGAAYGVGEGGYHGELQDVAETYRDPIIELGGRPIREVAAEQPSSAMDLAEKLGVDITTAADQMDVPRINAINVAADYGEYARTMLKNPEDIAAFDKMVDSGELVFKKGNVYESALHAADEKMLHWDKPLSEQSQKVQEAIRSLGIEPKGYQVTGSDWSAKRFEGIEDADGAGILEILGQELGDKYEVSKALESKGLKGIKFLDQASRGKSASHWKIVGREPTSNYIVFNPDDLEILRILGLTGAVLGTGAAVGSGTVLAPEEEVPGG